MKKATKPRKKKLTTANQGTILIDTLNLIAIEKGIDKEIIFEAIETSLVSACKKNFGTSQNIHSTINRITGEVNVFAKKEIVKEVADNNLEISLNDAKEIDINYNEGDFLNIVVTPKDFGRISAQTAKQVVIQKLREAEREIMYNEYISKEKEVMTGIVQRIEWKNVILSFNKIDAMLVVSQQIPNEVYAINSRKKVYVLEVKQTTKGPVMNVSRTHPELVKCLFKQEVPEIAEGIVEIVAISREPGSRTKMAVSSKNPNIDPIGSCVGQNGCRVNVIVSELGGEKIDIIQYSDDIATYISSALSPSQVVAAVVNKDDKTAKIVVPDKHLSLAIGKDGQNVRLAAKLTNYKIDIKSESQISKLKIEEALQSE